MDVTTIGQALSNKTRVKILELLATGSRSSIETHNDYEETYGEGKRRESIYRELENLVDAGLVTKYYDETGKQIEYELKHERVSIDFVEGSVSRYDGE